MIVTEETIVEEVMGDDGKPHITKETLVTVERHPHIHKHPKEIPDEHKDDVIEEL